MNNNTNNPINILKKYFFSLNPYEFSILANVLGSIISLFLSSNEKNSLGNWFELLGQQILTIQAQAITTNNNNISSEKLNDILNSLNFKIEYLEDLINYIKKQG